MQTFLPFENFSDSARALDSKRLGKQRVEAKQIYFALTKRDYGWKNHPAVLMWKGHEVWLLKYGLKICEEWIDRGFNDTLAEFFEKKHEFEFRKFEKADISVMTVYPPWLGDERLHLSHQMNLLRKDFTYYSSKFDTSEYRELYSEKNISELLDHYKRNDRVIDEFSLYSDYFWPTKSPDYNPNLLFDNNQQKS